MVTTKWFGQRQDTALPDIYVYDRIDDEARGKIQFAVIDCLERVKVLIPGEEGYTYVYRGGVDYLSRCLGRDIHRGGHHRETLRGFFLGERLADLFRGIEVILHRLLVLYSTFNDDRILREQVDLQKDLNKVFGLYRLGYRIEFVKQPGEDEPYFQIIRIDSEFTHEEMVKPTLEVLQREGLDTASKQFSDALGEFSDGNYGDAITDANSAFESVLKKILNRATGSAAELIRVAEEEGYFPQYLQDANVHFGKLLQGLPTVRHREGDAHGRLEPGENAERFARYAIHLAAANIIFMLDEYRRRGGEQSN